MKNVWTLLKGAVFALGMFAAASASAAIVVNPATGASGGGSFSGGVGTYVDFGGSTQLSLTLAGPSTIDFTAVDCCVTGDAFGFMLNGVLTPWTTETFPGGVGGNFIGFMDDLLLGAGTHIIELVMTFDCCGSGGMDWSISAATPTVPEPAALLLLGTALFGVVVTRRRSNASV